MLPLWPAVVAEVKEFEQDDRLPLGRAIAGLNAYSKGVSLGLFQPSPREVKEQRRKMRKQETMAVDLSPRAVPAKQNIRMKDYARSAAKVPFIPRACRSIWRTSSVTPSKTFLMPCWSSRSLCRP